MLASHCTTTRNMRRSRRSLKRFHRHRPIGGIPVAIRTVVLVGLLCGFTFLFPETACAKPKHATFEQVIENSATIVVARFLGEQPDNKKPTIQVEVTQVLKGDLKPGKYHLSFEDHPQIGA